MTRNEGMLMVGPLIEAKKRIAELEAIDNAVRKELDAEFECDSDFIAIAKHWVDRAEKAEAEVERLRQQLLEARGDQ